MCSLSELICLTLRLIGWASLPAEDCKTLRESLPNASVAGVR